MTASRADANPTIEAQGYLCLESPGSLPVELVADGQTLRIVLPGRKHLRQIARGFWQGRRRYAEGAHRALGVLGLKLEVELAGRVILDIGSGSRPTWLARMLGLAPARVPLSAIRVLWSR